MNGGSRHKPRAEENTENITQRPEERGGRKICITVVPVQAGRRGRRKCCRIRYAETGRKRSQEEDIDRRLVQVAGGG